jgi:hypothetical protein
VKKSTVPLCEACRREPATSLSWFADWTRWFAPRSGTWRFTGDCTADVELYYVMFHNDGRGFLDSTHARDQWLEHLREKRWFNRSDFLAMLSRCEQAGGVIERRPGAVTA